MIYRGFKDTKLSLLGFGTMRLPLISGTNEIDEEQVYKMTDYAMEHGVNYFDTAYPYHDCKSELVIGKALKKYPRESFYLADKYPGHQPSSLFNPKDIFAEQLEKCQVDYFDFYLLHNVTEFSMDNYMNNGICEYFIKMREEGKIKHLGFSCHARLENMPTFLEKYGKYMEFCQIQFNYVDWTLQDAKGKLELLKKYNIPVWVMEPIRGGALVKMGVDKAFRWVMQFPEVKMILSGMSDFQQMKDNVEIFKEEKPITEEECKELYAFAEEFKSSVPCTKCGYCLKSCPKGIDIPLQMQIYNEIRLSRNVVIVMQSEALDEDHRAIACLECGACAKQCPQHIEIPEVMKDLKARLADFPSWSQVCKEREAAAKKLLGLE